MRTEGVLSPDSVEDAREQYRRLIPAAKTVVRETAKAMEFDRGEYRDRVSEDVVATARDALFASLLVVHVGTREEFEDWRAAHPDYAVREVGSEHVDNVVWHAAPFAETAVAATFQDEPEAAAGTLRRQAFGRLYREHLE